MSILIDDAPAMPSDGMPDADLPNNNLVDDPEAIVNDEALPTDATEAPADDAPSSEHDERPTKFSDLGLPTELVNALSAKGLVTPFAIQTAAIPDALAGRDILGRAQTGSGKTLAFGLPMLARLADEARAERRRPLGIVLVPTRELAMQVHDSLTPMAHTLDVRIRLVTGGMSMPKQIESLNRGVEILVATPGRLRDLVDRKSCDLSDVKVCVLDEADQMADMGFLPEVSALMDQMPVGGQRMLFSATLDNDVSSLVKKYMSDPAEHSTQPVTASVTTMEHHVFLIDPKIKSILTAYVANRPGRTIIFVRTKMAADRIAENLRNSGVLASALHGGKTQGARNRVLSAFKTGRLPVLVATDVAARGIHVDDISLVLQVDPPADSKDYLHRAGRTARAGDRGVVVTVILPHQRRQMEALAAQAGVDATYTTIRQHQVESGPVQEITGGDVPSGEAVPEPILDRPEPRGRTGRGQGGRGGFDRGGRGRDFGSREGRGSREDRPRSDRAPRDDRSAGGSRDARGGRGGYEDRRANVDRGGDGYKAESTDRGYQRDDSRSYQGPGRDDSRGYHSGHRDDRREFRRNDFGGRDGRDGRDNRDQRGFGASRDDRAGGRDSRSFGRDDRNVERGSYGRSSDARSDSRSGQRFQDSPRERRGNEGDRDTRGARDSRDGRNYGSRDFGRDASRSDRGQSDSRSGSSRGSSSDRSGSHRSDSYRPDSYRPASSRSDGGRDRRSEDRRSEDRRDDRGRSSYGDYSPRERDAKRGGYEDRQHGGSGQRDGQGRGQYQGKPASRPGRPKSSGWANRASSGRRSF